MSAEAAGSFEPAGELKFGQVGVANLRVLDFDVGRLVAEMRERVERAPRLFGRAAVVVDFGSLSACPSREQAAELVAGLRQAGVCPVALAFGTGEVERLAEALELPVLAKFRAQYERAGEAAPEPPRPAPEAVPDAPAPAAPAPPAPSVGLVHTHPVRSGQQVYARGRDLVLTAPVGAGAEVIADGSVHVYAPLRGRALAGAGGDVSARIFCREFQAELVAIAGHYKVIEEVPAALRGRPVQVWLEGERLEIAEIR